MSSILFGRRRLQRGPVGELRSSTGSAAELLVCAGGAEGVGLRLCVNRFVLRIGDVFTSP